MTAFLAALALMSPQGGVTAPVAGTPPQAAGKHYAKLFICEYVNDDWTPRNPAKVVGDPKNLEFEWPAGKKYNILINNRPQLFGVSFLGVVLHKQGADGKDTDFIDEFMIGPLNEEIARVWGTEDGLPKHHTLEAGRYTFYIIKWGDRQINEHPGNFKDYMARITLHVK